MTDQAERWTVLWRSRTRLDGVTEVFMWEGGNPLLFPTRRAARAYIEGKYGYIKSRPDLQAEPHGWRLPLAVRVVVSLRSTR